MARTRTHRAATTTEQPIWLQVAIGVVLPSVIVVLVQTSDRPGQYRPFTVMLAVVVLLAVLVGRTGALVGAIVAVLLGWFVLVPPTNSFGLETTADWVGMAIFIATVAGVLLLVGRLERTRRHEADERAVVDALLDETPVGIALFDRDLRFRRLNRGLAEINGFPADQHIGRRPSELSPEAAELYEWMLEQVNDTGQAITDRTVSMERPEGDKHWRVSHYPVPDSAGSIVGIGATVEDITVEVVRRTRVELLLRISRAINRAVTVGDVERQVVPELVAALNCRVMVVALDEGGLQVRRSSGYDTEALDRWNELELAADDRSPLAVCLQEDRQVVVHPADAVPATGTEAALRAEVGDVSYVWQPITPAGLDRPVAAFSVAWPHPRVAMEETRLMLATVAVVAGAAVARIETAEEAAADRFRTAMDAMTDQVTLARSVRDEDGEIVDFAIEFMNRASIDGADRKPEELVGRRVCDLYPGWRTSGMFDLFREVVESGRPLVQDRMPYADETADGRPIRGYWNLQVVQVGDGYIAATRDVTDLVAAEETTRAAERAAEQARISVEMLQRAALPETLPELDWVTFGAHYKPAQREQAVGGDWYDAFELGDDRVGLVIADVSGHGAEAAALMVQVRNILRAFASEDPDPGAALTRVNDAIRCFHLDAGLFVTACFGVIDRRSGALTWSMAGHPPPILQRSGEAELLTAPVGPPLAPFPDREWKTSTRQLEPGDRLLFYTDGLVERRGELIDDGLDRLRAAFLERTDRTDQDLADELVATVDDPEDDVALLSVTYR